jgi:eukaryotic-like serine/threonine-protein kinase
MQHSWLESSPMETAPFGEGWEGRVVEGRFPLLKRLVGTENCGLYFTALQGMQEAIIQLIATDEAHAIIDVRQWMFATELSHPNLAKVYAAGRCVLDGKKLVYVVGDQSSTNLAQMLEGGRLEVYQAREIFSSIVDALIYLHSQGVVHGHVSPPNIHFAGSSPRLLLTDLLVAGTMKRSIPAAGNYDAPELRQGEVTAASDTWSLGLTMWEALTQTKPSWDLWRDGEPSIPESLPSPFRAIVQDCLRVDPKRRCTLEAVRELLGSAEAAPRMATAEATPRIDAAEAAPRIEAAPVQATVARVIAEPAQEEIVTAKVPVAARNIPVAEAQAVRRPLPARIERDEPREEPEDAAVFSGVLAHFEGAHLPQSRVMPFALVLLALIAIGGVFVARQHRDWFTSPAGGGNGGAVSATAPEKRAAPAASPGPAGAESAQAGSGQAGSAQADQTQADKSQTDQAQTKPSTEAAGPQQGAGESQPQAQSVPPTEAGSQASPMGGISQPPPSRQARAGETVDGKEESARGTREPADVPRDLPRNGPRADAEKSRRLNGEGMVEKQVMPAVSPGARESMRRPVQVLLRVTVNQKGTVADASYVVPGPGNYFARAAQRAAMEWKFKPPVRDGDPERSVWMLKFRFGREGTAATATKE